MALYDRRSLRRPQHTTPHNQHPKQTKQQITHTTTTQKKQHKTKQDKNNKKKTTNNTSRNKTLPHKLNIDVYNHHGQCRHLNVQKMTKQGYRFFLQYATLVQLILELML